MSGKLKGLLVAVVFLSGCASMFIKGGDLVKAGYKPDILVSYRAEGTVPQGVDYLLVKTETGPAVFERSPDGSGVLFLTRWQDGQDDHFAGWVANSHGYEYVIPADRSGNGRKYVYPAGFYSIKEIGGIARPVPVVQVDPVATLIPKK
ncbi:MAG: hypothetical protein A2010_01135 [Nitrospirae bacterium GWD2_57_9]|nr:MAG: hypothetical protein A2010_01135 [Nitrospirae bacterium GWD2_57_9]OGW50094.1 MAG: hypothetical protein A2078_13895 [Nitrospirae bacterium GWC2_57_9]